MPAASPSSPPMISSMFLACRRTRLEHLAEGSERGPVFFATHLHPFAGGGRFSPRRTARRGRILGCGKKNRAGLQKNPQRTRPERARKTSVRPEARRQSGRAMAAPRKLSPLARLIHALRQEKIRFQAAGMRAAILQAVPATTLHTDLWMDLPPRPYMRVLKLCRKLGATIRANTVVDLSD